MFWIRYSASSARPQSGNQAPLQARPYVEELESRNLPSVYTPAQVLHAYGFDRLDFTSNGTVVRADGSGQTIAIVDAYDHPNILSDLHNFDQTFRLPDPPSFIKATPQGQPAANALWALEIALDVEWAHAIAPRANILLVEARTNSGSDLLAAVDYARQQPGVVAVSMSWGSSEFASEAYWDSYFTTPAGHIGGSSGLAKAVNLPGGITFVASTGDNGAGSGPSWPSVSPNVLAVGGTSLTVWDSWGTYRAETGWSGSGGGVSAYEAEPGFQTSMQNLGKRSTPDVSYDADPNNSFYVYDSVAYGGRSGWFGAAGTSAAAPQWAALVAIADQGRALAGKGSLDGATQTLPALYALPASAFHDITTGSNGYTSTPGYDLVTGRGSPYAQQVVQALLGVTASGSLGAGSAAAAAKKAGAGTTQAHTFFTVVAAPSPSMTAVAPTAPMVQGFIPTVAARAGSVASVFVAPIDAGPRPSGDGVSPRAVAPISVLVLPPTNVPAAAPAAPQSAGEYRFGTGENPPVPMSTDANPDRHEAPLSPSAPQMDADQIPDASWSQVLDIAFADDHGVGRMIGRGSSEPLLDGERGDTDLDPSMALAAALVLVLDVQSGALRTQGGTDARGVQRFS